MCRSATALSPARRCPSCLPAARALSRAQYALQTQLAKLSAKRSGASFGAGDPEAGEAPSTDAGKPTLSKWILARLLEAGMAAQRAWGHVVATRDRARADRQLAQEHRAAAEADATRHARIRGAAQAVETSHLEHDRAEAEVFRLELLEQDLRPLEGWPDARYSMELQVAHARVEVMDLEEVIAQRHETSEAGPRSLRYSTDTRRLEANLRFLRAHEERLEAELKNLPTHAVSLVQLEAARSAHATAEGHVVRTEDAYEAL